MVAFKRQQDGDDIPRMLRREKALTRDASFVLIFLRREYAFADPDDGPVVISRDQISEFLRAYREAETATTPASLAGSTRRSTP